MLDLASIHEEPWAVLILPDPYAVAYQVGRLSNCLTWVTARAALVHLDHEFGRPMVFVLERLTELAHRVDGTAGDGPLAAAVAAVRRNWVASWDDGTRERWTENVSECPDEWGPWAWDPTPTMAEAFGDRFDDVQKAAMRLGRHVDRGVRPLPPDRGDLPDSEGRSLRKLIFHSRVTPEQFRHDPLWLGAVRGVAGAMGLTLDVPADVAPADVPGLVADLDRQARRGLEGLWAARAAPAAATANASANRPDATPDVRPVVQDTPEPPPPSAGELKRLQRLKRTIDPKGEYVGQSLPVLRLFAEIELVNRTPDSPVLILGPTGSGKTALAELVHRHSPRKERGFRRVSAPAVTNTTTELVREQWVGYAAGSTVQNASRQGRDGIIQECRGGTIFLDEVHAVPEWFQRFLFDVIDRLPLPRAHGPNDPVSPDVRMIFASNHSLGELGKELAPDFLRRITPAVLQVPPLADPKEDIPQLVKAWGQHHRPTPQFLLAMMEYSWPGNVGQLKEAMAQAVARTSKRGDRLLARYLNLRDPQIARWIEDLEEMGEEEAERRMYQRLVGILAGQGLEKRKGLQERLAKLLCVSEATVSRRCKDYLTDDPV